ncbi:SH3 domain-containing protein [Xylanimonas sp. McL0601]|uniref:SH3 domain-containing protein n=1 Tax=Xylanimonas sp. McL0601 TaxID=3414739 RepID=UPI003CF5CB43
MTDRLRSAGIYLAARVQRLHTGARPAATRRSGVRMLVAAALGTLLLFANAVVDPSPALAATVPAGSVAAYGYRWVHRQASVRVSPTTSARALVTVKKGTRLDPSHQKGGWLRVTVSGKTGWIQQTSTGVGTPSGVSAMESHYGFINQIAISQKVDWSTTSGRGSCGSSNGCSYGERIQISTYDPVYKTARQAVRRASLTYVMVHEIAHVQTYRQCGTPRPAITGSRHESVADAYAVLKFRAQLKAGGVLVGYDSSNHFGLGDRYRNGYGYGSSDVSAATKVGSGICRQGQTTETVRYGGFTLHLSDGGAAYVVPAGAKLATITTPGTAWTLVRDAKGRRGQVRTDVWRKPTRSVVTSRAGTAYQAASLSKTRAVRTGETFGYIRSYDASFDLVAQGSTLWVVPKSVFRS